MNIIGNWCSNSLSTILQVRMFTTTPRELKYWHGVWNYKSSQRVNLLVSIYEEIYQRVPEPWYGYVWNVYKDRTMESRNKKNTYDFLVQVRNFLLPLSLKVST